MIDARLVGCPFNEPTLWMGRFTGANANALSAVTSTSKRMTLTRTGTGALTLQLTDPTPGGTGNGTIGVVQNYSAWVNSPNNAKNVLMTPPNATATSFSLQVAWPNGTAVDVQSYEELNVEVWTARSINP